MNALGSVTAGELIFGAFNKAELRNIQKDINELKVLQINKKSAKILLI